MMLIVIHFFEFFALILDMSEVQLKSNSISLIFNELCLHVGVDSDTILCIFEKCLLDLT